MALPRANGSSYDVFLSFRGEDTRHSFTDHLYEALKRGGILSFRDSDDAERGEELKVEIERAIKTSDASIIVLSENYATSTWCLDELSLILDERRDRNHFVLPLFYKVDPSDVGKQKGTFMIAAKPSGRWTHDNVIRWKAALTEVVGVIGMSLDGSEAKFIKEVVDTIYNRLDRKQIYIPRNIIGVDARYKEILNSWLTQSEAKFLVIYGMPGSGKSTLAQYIVYSYCQHFESNSIVEKIGIRCKNPHEMVILQKQLYSDISKGKESKIQSVCQGTAQIEVLLEKIKALIVLDSIVKEGQLEDLLGSGNINKDSKIIITTDNDISNWFKSTSKRCQEYPMKLLNADESLELLSLHAFRSKTPKDGFEVLAQQAVLYCDGNPLALRVLGSSLSQKNTITSWESELNLFKKDFHGDIYDVLKLSYDSLPYFEKQLFLHIACFFVGEDVEYVVKVLEPDYGAESKIKTLTKRCFLYVTPEKKLMMHRLLQEMGRNLVDHESHSLTKRTRVWRNTDSYDMLRRKKSSMTIEGLALDMRMLMKEDGFKLRPLKELSTVSLQKMDRLKLLKLNFVELNGSYEDSSERLRWLSWVGFHESTIRTDIFMGNLVALDLSYSCLKEFEPPSVLHSLKILNLKDSHKLLKIHKIYQIPNLEKLILWNCHSLFHVCGTIGNLERLALLNMTGCKALSRRDQLNTSVELEASTSDGQSTEELSFPLPHSLQRLFLNECNLECTVYFPMIFSDRSSLQYMNLGSGLFEILSSFNRLKHLRVLDLKFCRRLKRLLCLPSTLAELYVNHCKSLEKITFESGQFTLQEFGYEGCINLSEVEGYIKLVLLAKLDETDLGHMMWLKEYENHDVFLAGDYELTKDRSSRLQMLYEFEFNIMSISLPDISHPNLVPEHISPSMSLSFGVPSCSRNRRLKGLDLTFKYTISGDDWVWFVKISTANGVDLMYYPKVFGKPLFGEVCIWLSYWPIGNLLDVGDEVNVTIVVMSGLVVLECGASLVYIDDDVAPEILENKIGWVEKFGQDLSAFQLRKKSYYLCRRDFYKLMEVGRLTPGWLSILVGDTIDDTEVRGWRMTGRPKQSYQSFTELKIDRCIIYGSEKEQEETYMIAETPSPSFIDKTRGFTSSIHGETVKLGTTSATGDAEIEEQEETYKQIAEISSSSFIDETVDFTSNKLGETVTSGTTSAFSNVEIESTKMDKLKLLKLKDVELSGSHQNFPEHNVTSLYRSSMTSAQTRRFSLAEIQSATNDFDERLVIGLGRHGKVYKGRIGINETGHFVAIKRLDFMSNLLVEAEIEMLSELRHRHLVSLIGYCNDHNDVFLVHEYMPNGTLYDHLHKAATPLTWVQRLKIGIGAARGLDFLHTSFGTHQGVIHRDVKSSNILLDGTWEAKISDFGLSKIVSYSVGYLDPEFFATGRITRKSDVYSFGVVLIELLSGRFPKIEIGGLARWAQRCVQKRKLEQLVDYKIRGTIAPKCLREFAQLADRCCLHDPRERPTMNEIVASLETLLEQQEKADDSAKSSGMKEKPDDSAKSSGIKGSWSKMKKYFGL